MKPTLQPAFAWPLRVLAALCALADPIWYAIRPQSGPAAHFLLLGAAAALLVLAAPAPIPRRTWLLLFGLYLYLLWRLTLLDGYFGRSADGVGAREARLVPFVTIGYYLRRLLSGEGMRAALVNLAGNLAAFAPFGFFLPLLWKPMRRLWPFLGAVTLAVCLVEGMQYALGCGVCEIDDWILNTAGAALVWLVFRRVDGCGQTRG